MPSIKERYKVGCKGSLNGQVDPDRLEKCVVEDLSRLVQSYPEKMVYSEKADCLSSIQPQWGIRQLIRLLIESENQLK